MIPPRVVTRALFVASAVLAALSALTLVGVWP